MTDPAALSRHEARQGRMLADPALSGELLRVALAAGRLVDLQACEPPWSLHDLAGLAFPCPTWGHGPAWQSKADRQTRTLIADDRPRQTGTGIAGGVLARHVPEVEWAALWVRIVPGWTAPAGWTPPTPEPVPLTCLPGGGQHVDMPRPRLRLLHGGR